MNLAQQEDEKYYGWHLDKRVSVGHLATTLVVVATFVVWLMSMNGEIQLVKNEVIRNKSDVADIRFADKRHEDAAKLEFVNMENRINAQTKRLEGRMEAQYNEIIRRLEVLDQRLIDNSVIDNNAHDRTNG